MGGIKTPLSLLKQRSTLLKRQSLTRTRLSVSKAEGGRSTEAAKSSGKKSGETLWTVGGVGGADAFKAILLGAKCEHLAPCSDLAPTRERRCYSALGLGCFTITKKTDTGEKQRIYRKREQSAIKPLRLAPALALEISSQLEAIGPLNPRTTAARRRSIVSDCPAAEETDRIVPEGGLEAVGKEESCERKPRSF